MSLIKVNGKYSNTALLLAMTIPNEADLNFWRKRAMWMAIEWAPKNAKSFSPTVHNHTVPDNQARAEDASESRIWVSYYTTAKEGKYKVNRRMVWPDWETEKRKKR